MITTILSRVLVLFSIFATIYGGVGMFLSGKSIIAGIADRDKWMIMDGIFALFFMFAITAISIILISFAS